MEAERIELSARERERLKVLHEIEQGHLKQIEAAQRHIDSRHDIGSARGVVVGCNLF